MEYECGFAQLVTSALPLSLGCFRPQADPSSSRTRMPILYLFMAQELDRKHGPNCQKQHHHDQPEFPRYKFPHPLPPLRHLRSLQPSPRHPSPKKGRRAPEHGGQRADDAGDHGMEFGRHVDNPGFRGAGFRKMLGSG